MTFICNICLKQFDKKFNLNRHIEKKKNSCQQNIPKYSENIPNIPKTLKNIFCFFCIVYFFITYKNLTS